MVPWIQVYSNILTHDKTYALAEQLKVPNYGAVGLMVSLWSWAAINAPDGNITAYPKRAIADAAGWSKGADKFYQVLLNVRLIEQLEDGRVMIRNWERYAALLMDMMDEQKKKTTERVRKHRQKKTGSGNVTDISKDEAKDKPSNVTETPEKESNEEKCNVTETLQTVTRNATETLCNGATEPNLTKPNITKPKDKDHPHPDHAAADGEIAKFIEHELCMTLSGVAIDQINSWLNEWPDREVIRFAISEAVLNNKRSIKYVDAILRGWRGKGIKTIAQAKAAKAEFEAQKATAVANKGAQNKTTRAPDNFKTGARNLDFLIE